MREPIAEGPTRDAGTRRIHRLRDRRVLIPALIVSALLHGAAFLTFHFSIPTEPRTSSAPVVRIVEPVVPPMRALELRTVQGDAAPVEVQLAEQEARRRPESPMIPRGGGEQAIGDVPAPAADPMSVRDRLRYRWGSTPQVWAPPPPIVLEEEISPQEMARQRIASQLGEYNDSIAAEAAARERATDWTVRDGGGGRWGVSPEGVHVGGITIPIPVAMATPAGRREEIAGRIRTWGEIQGQAVREEARGEFRDRVRAIEERMNRERTERTDSTRATTGTGSSTGNNSSGNNQPGG